MVPNSVDRLGDSGVLRDLFSNHTYTNGDRQATANCLAAPVAARISADSSGTNVAYQSAWNSWCTQWQIDPLLRPIQPLFRFYYKEGLKYHSISMAHDHIEELDLKAP